MGQRLNLEITKDNHGTILAAGYYHWSGYTYSAMQIVIKALDAIRQMGEGEYNNLRQKSDVLAAIRILEATGAGLCEVDRVVVKSSRDIAQEMFPDEEFKPVIDRNHGLIEITEEGIKMIQKWEEAKVQICLDDLTIDFFSAVCVDNVDDYLEYMYGDTSSPERAIVVLPRLKVDLARCNYCEDMTVDEFHEFVEIIDIMERTGYYSAVFEREVYEQIDGEYVYKPQIMIISLIA